VRRPGGENGFTLIELIATMIVLGVAAAMAAPLALELTRSATSAERSRVELGDARRALETIGQTLRAAPELDETVPGESGLESLGGGAFERADGLAVRLEEGALWLLEGGDRRLLAAPVESAAFRGYEADGATEAADAAMIRRVEYEVTTGGLTLAGVAALRTPGATATITWTVDNIGELYVNGTLVDQNDNWMQARQATVALREGENVIAVRARDTGGPAAILVDVELGGSRVGTSGAWRVSRSASAGWTDVGFDDVAWDSATEHGAVGTGAWGTRVRDFPGESPAVWIWTNDLQNDNEAYFRATLGVSGGSVAIVDVSAIDFDERELVAFGGYQDGQFGLSSSFETLDGGRTLRLAGNAWKAIEFPYEPTANTVIEFEFASPLAGEIQGIGLAQDLDIDARRAIQVSGEQHWGWHRAPDVPAYAGEGAFRSYRVRLGDLPREFPSGETRYLVFISDDDNREHDDGLLGEALFRNVRVYEGW